MRDRSSFGMRLELVSTYSRAQVAEAVTATALLLSRERRVKLTQDTRHVVCTGTWECGDLNKLHFLIRPPEDKKKKKEKRKVFKEGIIGLCRQPPA